MIKDSNPNTNKKPVKRQVLV